MFYLLPFLAILLPFLGLVIIRIFFILTLKVSKSKTCLKGKTCLVTGGSTGIGYETAKDFAMRGARVIIACKFPELYEVARRKIVQETGNMEVTAKFLDLASFASVRKFCEEINEEESRLDVLVNNAGILSSQEAITKDNLCPLVQVNFLGPMLLTHLLIDKMKTSAPARVVFVASIEARFGHLVAEKIKSQKDKPLRFHEAYRNSKQGLILASRVLAEKLRGSGINVYTLNPGIVNTGILNQVKWYKWINLNGVFSKFAFKTSEEGAQTSIHCAVSKELENDTGRFYSGCREISFYSSCVDMKVAERVYAESEELMKLAANERIVDCRNVNTRFSG